MGILSNLFKKKDEIEIKRDAVHIENMDDEDEIAAVIAAVVESMNEEDEIVAAITAAISCMLGKSTSEFVVRNIKRTSEIDSLWALRGRMNQMR
ncbi:MAG TPA: hypothetical protein DEF04_03140 [Clostridiales bacterium]|nr:hypothetical protein [Clostridiales bacterium]